MSRSADGSAADHNGPGEHDPVRSSPPEDPWLTEAPTSAFTEAGAAGDPVPFAETARFSEPVPFDSPPSGWGDAPPPRKARGRRAARWFVAVLAVAALFIAGMLALDQFGSDGGGRDNDALGPGPSTSASLPGNKLESTSTPAPTRSGVPAVVEPVVTASSRPDSSASASAPAGDGPVVVYEVTASGSKNTGSVSYTDQDGDIIRLNGIALPWRVTFALGARRKPPLVLISQRKGGGNAGPVTCTITLDGKLLSSTTAEGRYAAPQCSG